MPDQLLASDEHLRLVINTAINAVVTMDGEGLVTGWNPSAESMFGWTAGEAIGQPVADLIVPPALRARHQEGLRHYMATGEGPVLGTVIVLSAVRRDGSEFPVELAISPASRTADGVVFVAFIHDITDRAAADEAQRADATRIAELERAKSLLLSVASHELRGPISLLKGYLDMLGEGSLGEISPQLTRVLSTLKGRVNQMDLLVARMLETARLEDPGHRLRLEEADLGVMAERGVETIRGVAPSDMRIEVEGTPAPVRVDVEKVQTAINNLVENAVKYSPGGRLVRCKVVGDGSMFALTVEDFGLGIAEAEVGQLFTRFGRLSNTEAPGIPGIGLGLYISRELVRQHGGDITVVSQEGHGSIFTLTLPREAAS